MLIFALIFTVAVVVLMPVYLLAEVRSGSQPKGFQKATALKMTISGLCALCALVGYLLWGMPEEPVRAFIPLALVCSVAGDYYLQFISLDSRKLQTGILFFALTQLFLIVYLCLHYGVSWPEFALAAALTGSFLVVVFRRVLVLGKVQWPLVSYVALLGFMVSKAVLPLFGATITLSLVLLAGGALLFITSDLLLGIKNFSKRKKAGAKLHLIPYFCALLLLALSVIS
ncbi:MAG: lysoplasmalogenase [Coriobacteriales bacterium]|jgi:uncharacterized membrane protein YhhN|nr:lysoplasmalogenase [Coriobacteriales bacterium]